MQKADIENVKSATSGGTIERVLTSFAKLPKTNMRTDILPNPAAVFIMLLPYQSAIIYRRTRYTFTKSNGLYANRVGNTT